MLLNNASPANSVPHIRNFSYHPTLLDNAGLITRLSLEVSFLLTRFKSRWPAFREHPLRFSKRGASRLFHLIIADRRRLATTTAGLLVVSSSVLLVIVKDQTHRTNHQVGINARDDVQILDLSTAIAATSVDTGIGTGSLGRLGFGVGRGEGSNLQPKKAQGGGSGGLRNPLPPSKGRIPVPSEIPAPIPTTPPARNPSLPAAGIDIDPALWAALPHPNYGDPKANSTIASNGPGENGGIGTNSGLGIGDGRDNGYGPGTRGNIGGGPRELGGNTRGGATGNNPNDPDLILRASMVGQRARVLSKPEPQYTEEARRNQITGTVVLRVVFSKTGEVTNIRALNTLPFGLTERAIAAARRIRFLPATKDNLPVSVHMQLEYNFNLY